MHVFQDEFLNIVRRLSQSAQQSRFVAIYGMTSNEIQVLLSDLKFSVINPINAPDLVESHTLADIVILNDITDGISHSYVEWRKEVEAINNMIVKGGVDRLVIIPAKNIKMSVLAKNRTMWLETIAQP